MYTADRETGIFIESVKSIEEGLKFIKEYEKADGELGIFSYGFYDIVDENHCSLLNQHVDK